MSEQLAEFHRPEGLKVRYRRMKFDFEDQGFPRYWHSNSPFISFFWDQLSTAFEPGEKFFIDSTRALRGEVDNPELLEEIQEFCKQEGHHTAQHLKFDRINGEMGKDIDGVRGRYSRALARTREGLSDRGMLAVTMALEHFTSGFAELYLKQPHFSEGADPKVNALWQWHAAEEMEHKGTAFDVHRAIGGSNLAAKVIMPVAWMMLIVISLINTFTLVRKEGTLFSRDTLRGIRYLFGRRGVLPSLLPTFLEYYRPRFHPWKRDDSAEITQWEQRNQHYIQNLDQVQAAAPRALTATAAPTASAA